MVPAQSAHSAFGRLNDEDASAVSPSRRASVSARGSMSVRPLAFGLVVWSLYVANVAHAEDSERPRLEESQPVRAEVTVDSPTYVTPTLAGAYTDGAVRAYGARLRTPDEGAWRIEARSLAFDTYLVVRTPGGEIVAEDDDGGIATHSRITSDALRPSTEYLIEVCALHGDVGSFELRLELGEAPVLSPDELRSATLDELRSAVELAEREAGANSERLASWLAQLASALARYGRWREAEPHARRALSITTAGSGEASAATAKRRNNLATILQALARDAEAEALLREALAVLDADRDADPMTRATAMNNLAVVLEKRGRTAEAKTMLERALALRQRLLGGVHPLIAETLMSLGAIERRRGAWDEARAAYERAHRMIASVLGADHEATIPVRRRLVELELATGRFGEAAAALAEVSRIADRDWPIDDPRHAALLADRAAIAMQRAEYDEACALYERAIERRRESLGADHPATARLERALATTYDAQGRLELARPLHERALAITRSQLGEDHPETLVASENFAWHLSAKGLHGEAARIAERIVAVRERRDGPDHPDTIVARDHHAALLDRLGSTDEARAAFARSLASVKATYGNAHPLAAKVLDHIARVDRREGRLADAARAAEQALAIRSATYGDDHPFTAESRATVALLAVERRRTKEATVAARAAADALDARLGATHPSTVRAQRILARAVADTGDVAAAVTIVERALDAALAEANRIANALTESERLHYAQELGTTLDLYLGLSRAAGSKSKGSETHARLLAWKGRVSRSLLADGVLRDAERSRAERDRVARLRQVQSRLSDLLYARDGDESDARVDRLESLRREREDLERRLVMRAERAATDPTKHDTEASRRVASSLPPDTAALDFFVHRGYRTAGPATDTPEGDAEGGTYGVPRVSVWVVRGGSDDARWIDLGEAELLRKRVEAYLSRMVSFRGLTLEPTLEDPEQEGPGDVVRTALWEPIRSAVGDAAHVIVSPDDFLGTFPFATLLIDEDRYLIERCAVSYLQDLTELVSGAPDRAAGPSSMLIAGAVDYRKRDPLPQEGSRVASSDGDSETEDARLMPSSAVEDRGGYRAVWRPLSATREELDAIVDIHTQAYENAPRLVLTRGAATEERVRESIGRHRYVHLATHGYFQPEGLRAAWASRAGEELPPERFEAEERITGQLPGLLSGLVLAGANIAEPGRANGLMTAEELTYLDLAQCDLVVLSACQTGLGRAASGEGAIGLRRALRQAGARTVVASLWSVIDEATRDLMIAFYEQLWLEGRSEIDALREAQLSLLARSRAEYGHPMPARWGAFVVDGIPRH